MAARSDSLIGQYRLELDRRRCRQYFGAWKDSAHDERTVKLNQMPSES